MATAFARSLRSKPWPPRPCHPAPLQVPSGAPAPTWSSLQPRHCPPWSALSTAAGALGGRPWDPVPPPSVSLERGVLHVAPEAAPSAGTAVGKRVTCRPLRGARGAVSSRRSRTGDGAPQGGPRGPRGRSGGRTPGSRRVSGIPRAAENSSLTFDPFLYLRRKVLWARHHFLRQTDRYTQRGKVTHTLPRGRNREGRALTARPYPARPTQPAWPGRGPPSCDMDTR